MPSTKKEKSDPNMVYLAKGDVPDILLVRACLQRIFPSENYHPIIKIGKHWYVGMPRSCLVKAISEKEKRELQKVGVLDQKGKFVEYNVERAKRIDQIQEAGLALMYLIFIIFVMGVVIQPFQSNGNIQAALLGLLVTGFIFWFSRSMYKETRKWGTFKRAMLLSGIISMLTGVFFLIQIFKLIPLFK